jgi:hypothetical protein
MIELAWLWLRHQPDSDLSRWFVARVGDGRGRLGCPRAALAAALTGRVREHHRFLLAQHLRTIEHRP